MKYTELVYTEYQEEDASLLPVYSIRDSIIHRGSCQGGGSGVRRNGRKNLICLLRPGSRKRALRFNGNLGRGEENRNACLTTLSVAPLDKG